MTELSPAAQAVLDAANNENSYYCLTDGPDDCLNESRWIAAAALRAAADHVVPSILEEEFCDRNHSLPLQKIVEVRQKLLAIADELEGA